MTRFKAQHFCTALILIAGLASTIAFGWFVYMGRLDRYPVDLWWWEGIVGANTVALDGDQDLLTVDGHYIVLDKGATMKPGDNIYLLHASTADGDGSLTFHCLDKSRAQCANISLVINFPRDTRTLNQGHVPAKAPAP